MFFVVVVVVVVFFVVVVVVVVVFVCCFFVCLLLFLLLFFVVVFCCCCCCCFCCCCFCFRFTLVDHRTGIWEKYLVTGDWSQSTPVAVFVSLIPFHCFTALSFPLREITYQIIISFTRLYTFEEEKRENDRKNRVWRQTTVMRVNRVIKHLHLSNLKYPHFTVYCLLLMWAFWASRAIQQ